MCYRLKVGLASWIPLTLYIPFFAPLLETEDLQRGHCQELFAFLSPIFPHQKESVAKTDHVWPMDQDFQIRIAGFMAGK